MDNQHAKVLVVDDIEDNRYTLTTLLQIEGFENITTAEDGVQALELLKDHEFDLVLLDVMMPRLSGYEVLERLLAEGRLGDLPVIVISALTEMASAVRCISLGAEDYLPKPFEQVLLKARINACLEKKILRDRVKAHLTRIEAELEEARRLQLSMVPANFPVPTPERPIEIFATMDPAREVGGDLYDYYYLDDGRLCFLIGDVSDKGVPSALFMARTKEVVHIVSTLFRPANQKHASAAQILAQVNSALCRDNKALMFVTLFIGIIDPQNGELEFCNAGHNAPFLVTRSGGLSEISGSKGRPLGIRSTSIYESGHLKLDFDDFLLLFTDGVTESMNERGELFGEERVERILRSHVPPGPTSVIPAIMSAIVQFRGASPQADDITMLALRRLSII